MARIISNTECSQIENRGEKAVFSALEQYEKLDCSRETFPLSHGHAVLLPDVHTGIQTSVPNMIPVY